MPTYTATPGNPVSNTTIGPGDTLQIENGGSGSGNTLTSGGTETVYAGGAATATVVHYGGAINVSSGGAIYNTDSLDGIETIAGIASATTVGGFQYVLAGGKAYGSIITSGSGEFISSGGVSYDAQVQADGNEIVNAGGTTSGATVDSGGHEYVSGMAIATTVSGGGYAGVGAGGTTTGTIIESGGFQSVGSGGTTSGDTINGGGAEYADYGATINSATINSGADLLVGSNATTYGTRVNSGAVEFVTTGGAASGTVVAQGGYVAVLSGASVTGVSGAGTVLSSGIIVYQNGITVYPASTSGLVLSGIEDEAVLTGAAISTVLSDGGHLAVYGVGTATGTTVGVDGSVAISGGTAYGTTVSGGGYEYVTSGGVESNGTIAGGTLQIDTGASATGSITFTGSDGTLIIDSSVPTAPISGFAPGDSIYLLAVLSAGGTGTASVLTPGVVTISAAGETYDLDIAGATADETDFSIDGGALTETIACFYPSTLIRTTRGEVAVEALLPGDLLITACGAARPLRWLGRSSAATGFADPLRVLPIRITASALGNNIPLQDLLVSPDHAIFLGGVLIQAAALINGTSITREADVPPHFTYYHVELASHELIFANGTLAESFVDNAGRMNFDNWPEHQALGAAAPIFEMAYPRAKSARQVPQAVQAWLRGQAAA